MNTTFQVTRSLSGCQCTAQDVDAPICEQVSDGGGSLIHVPVYGPQ